jgi:carboxyl-terminal processing protease
MPVPANKSTQSATTPPKNGIPIFTFCVAIVLVLVIGIIIGTRSDQIASQFLKNRQNEKELNLSSVQTTYNKLKEEYNGKLNTASLVEGANRGLVEAAGDPYTVYLNHKEAEEFDKDLDGTFSGIGAELDKKDNKLIIVSPLDDSPAQKAGLQPGDIVVQVNGQDTASWPVDKAVSQIKGKEGTTVKLTILRAEEVKEISITRAVITDPSVKSEQKDNLGIIRISRFGNDTASLVRKAAQTFKDSAVRGIILDLRGNGGGYLEAAQEVSSVWLENGAVVVTEKGTHGTETERASGSPLLQGVPTVVLIDGGSASASEIVAGALKDNKAATLVGTKSFGKGSVQKVFKLSGGNELKITIAKWYTPAGKNISKEGIKPDENVAFGKNDTRENDPQLNRAIELLK